MSIQTDVRRVTLTTLQKMKHRGEKFAAVTAYDACFVEMLLSSGAPPGAPDPCGKPRGRLA